MDYIFKLENHFTSAVVVLA